jgi:antitoxin component of RelBE/YafQ-DinJ toxin-antitoxin module
MTKTTDKDIKTTSCTFKVEPELLQKFQEVCKSQDISVSKAIRDFMRKYIVVNSR